MASKTSDMSARANPLSLYDRADRAAQVIRARAQVKPSIAIVLGSGLGAFADELSDSTFIRYDDIPGFAQATADSQAGRPASGKSAAVPMSAMEGRFPSC